MSHTLIRIKRIITADFRLSAATLYDNLRRSRSTWCGDIEPGEAYLLLSYSGNQLMFLLGAHHVVTRPGTRYEARRTLIDSRTWRIDGGVFSPLMLENYANSVGLTLGKKTFAEHWIAK